MPPLRRRRPLCDGEPGRHSFAGRIGRAVNPPPQLGQTLRSSSRTLASQKVHSYEQMRASVDDGARSLSHISQLGRSSSAMMAEDRTFKRLLSDYLVVHIWFPRPCQPPSRASAAPSTRPSAINTKSAPGGTRSAPSPGSLLCRVEPASEEAGGDKERARDQARRRRRRQAPGQERQRRRQPEVDEAEPDAVRVRPSGAKSRSTKTVEESSVFVGVEEGLYEGDLGAYKAIRGA